MKVTIFWLARFSLCSIAGWGWRHWPLFEIASSGIAAFDLIDEIGEIWIISVNISAF